MRARDPGEARGSTISRTSDRARWLRRWLRDGLFRLIGRGLGAQASQPLPELGRLERVLLVQVSQRLGHTLLVTPGLDALLERLRAAHVVFVGGPHAPAVLEGYGLDRVEVTSRFGWLHPWRFPALLRRLRAERFDAAIHLGTSSRSVGPFLVGLSGAVHRIGRTRDGSGVFFTTPVPRSPARHKVDAALDYLAALGAPAAGERRMLLRLDEIAAAQAYLKARIADDSRPPVGLFVGGRTRKGKDWSLSNFAAIARGLRSRDIPLVVLLGPEESRLAREIRSAIGEAVYVEGVSLRTTASIVACCGAVLSLDSGPMHLAIAVGAPTVAVFRKSNFDRWGPRPPLGEVIYDPEGNEAQRVLETLLRLYDARSAHALRSERHTPLRRAGAARAASGS